MQPVSLEGAISVIFGNQFSSRVHYCKRGEVCFTIVLCQNNGRQNGLISRMLFSELFKLMVKKVTFVFFRGGDCPPLKPTKVTFFTMDAHPTWKYHFWLPWKKQHYCPPWYRNISSRFYEKESDSRFICTAVNLVVKRLFNTGDDKNSDIHQFTIASRKSQTWCTAVLYQNVNKWNLHHKRPW